MTDQSSKGVTLYLVLYQWQGAQDLTTDMEWYDSADVYFSKDGAAGGIERCRNQVSGRPGKLTYRNVRGPFEWSESPDETESKPRGISLTEFARRCEIIGRAAAQLDAGFPDRARKTLGEGLPVETSAPLTSRQHAARNALQGCTCGSDGDLHQFTCQLRRDGDDGKGAVNGTGDV